MSKTNKVYEPYHIFYKTFWPLTKGIFCLRFFPKFENKKLIPKKGPIIICCNHIHVLDQMGPIFSTYRMLHYMAKKEYFDSKFAWFFKIAGCISVNRKSKDDQAKRKAMHILNNGMALGIFPEGTRNQVSSKQEYFNKLYEYYKDRYNKKKFMKILKENQVRVSEINLLDDILERKIITKQEYIDNIINPRNLLIKLYKDKKISEKEYLSSYLLDLKYGAVSMAQKSNATIVPCAITGKYKLFKGNLKYTFLEPIKVNENDNLEKVNELLYNRLTKQLAKKDIY